MKIQPLKCITQGSLELKKIESVLRSLEVYQWLSKDNEGLFFVIENSYLLDAIDVFFFHSRKYQRS